MVIKIKKIKNPQNKTYIQAKDEVTKEYVSVTKTKKMEELAKSRVKLFKGLDVGYINKNTTQIGSLTQTQTKELINYIFSNNSKNGYKIIDNNVILYNITDQRISQNSANTNNSNLLGIKADILNSNLIKKLKLEYKIQSYYNIQG